MHAGLAIRNWVMGQRASGVKSLISDSYFVYSEYICEQPYALIQLTASPLTRVTRHNHQLATIQRLQVQRIVTLWSHVTAPSAAFFTFFEQSVSPFVKYGTGTCGGQQHFKLTELATGGRLWTLVFPDIQFLHFRRLTSPNQLLSP